MTHRPRRSTFVSADQLAALIDFVDANPELALGWCNRTTEGRSKAQRLWQECADILNSVGVNCHTKEAKDWRTYFSEFKSKLLKKVRVQKAECIKTEGGPAKEISLTPLQDRLYTILGRDVGDPLSGTTPCNVINEPEQKVWLADEHNEQRDQSGTPPSLSTEPQSPHLKPPLWMSLDREPSSENIPTRRNSGQARRRRRGQRGAESSSSSNLETAVSSSEHAEARLARIEQASANATLEHARATNRLATAVELLAQNMALISQALLENLRSPQKRYGGSRRPRRLYVESDSE